MDKEALLQLLKELEEHDDLVTRHDPYYSLTPELSDRLDQAIKDLEKETNDETK